MSREASDSQIERGFESAMYDFDKLWELEMDTFIEENGRKPTEEDEKQAREKFWSDNADEYVEGAFITKEQWMGI